MKFRNKQIYVFLLLWVLMILSITSCGKPIQQKKINVGQSNYFQPELIRTIAIMPLMHGGTDQNIADAIMHELAVQILRLDRFSMVDSYKVSTLVEAEGLEGSGLSDSIVKKIGSELSQLVNETLLNMRRYLIDERIKKLQEINIDKNKDELLQEVMRYSRLKKVLSSKLNRVV